MNEETILKFIQEKIIRFLVLLLCILLLPVNAAAHSGRTDANGGHHDYKNKSGLGSYHYHCGGNPPHLHPDGICPYGNNAEDSQPVYTPPSPSVKITDYPKELNVGDTKGIEYTIENASSSCIFLCGSTAVPEERKPPVRWKETVKSEQGYRT